MSKKTLGAMIAELRKAQGMTQLELAEKMGVTDKAVSKWERGESIPDVMTMVQLAELFGISLDDLTGRTAPAESASKPQEQPCRSVNKPVIEMLVSLLVWFVALFINVVLSSLDVSRSWLGFVYAVPANAIVLLSLRSAWRRYNWNLVLVSLIVWGSLVSFYVTMLIFLEVNIWKLFLLGVLGQAAVFLWFRMFRSPKEEKDG